MALDYEKLSKEFTKKLQEFDKEKIDAWMEKDAINLPFKSTSKMKVRVIKVEKFNPLIVD